MEMAPVCWHAVAAMAIAIAGMALMKLTASTRVSKPYRFCASLTDHSGKQGEMRGVRSKRCYNGRDRKAIREVVAESGASVAFPRTGLTYRRLVVTLIRTYW